MVRLVSFALVSLLSNFAIADEQLSAPSVPSQQCVPYSEDGQSEGYKCSENQPSGRNENTGFKNLDMPAGMENQPPVQPAYEQQRPSDLAMPPVENQQDQTY